MAEDTKAILRIVGLLAIGLAPGVIGLLVTPTRGVAIAAAASAAMAIVFVLWTHRLVADLKGLRASESSLRDDVSELEGTVQDQVRELRDAKMHDNGTSVLNRTAFLRRLDDTVTRDARLGKALTFLVVDVEGFKVLNLERGRVDGDAILRRVAHALEEATRGTDCVGRLGGDEFGVILGECEDPGPAVNRIFSNLQSAESANGAIPIHVAVGAVTIEHPAQGVDIQELFRIAEVAIGSVRGTGGSLCARRTMCASSDRQPVPA
jgi:diguanylate cyclase (GGDEF)-like protein